MKGRYVGQTSGDSYSEELDRDEVEDEKIPGGPGLNERELWSLHRAVPGLRRHDPRTSTIRQHYYPEVCPVIVINEADPFRTRPSPSKSIEPSSLSKRSDYGGLRVAAIFAPAATAPIRCSDVNNNTTVRLLVQCREQRADGNSSAGGLKWQQRANWRLPEAVTISNGGVYDNER
jgi:hypothetical protein